MIRYSAVALAASATSNIGLAADEETEVNDIHSQLNRTRVARVVRPASLDQLRAAILDARREGLAISIAGSRHSMGGQQFGTGMLLLDTRDMNRVTAFDPASRIIEAETGVEWPELLSELSRRQAGAESQLGIFQKQTGADRLSLGGPWHQTSTGEGCLSNHSSTTWSPFR